MSRKPFLRPSTAAREELLERRVADLERMMRRVSARDIQGGLPATTQIVQQTTHGLAVKDVVRHNGTSWTKSQADTAANAVVGGMVVAVLSPDLFVLATPGSYVTGLSSLTAGSVHYLDASTAGALTTTAPTIAVPILLADSTSSGVIMAAASSGSSIASPTEDGTVFASNSGGTAGEWVRTLDLGRNAASKAGKLQILSPDASGVAVEIDGALVTASSKKLTVREIDVCDAGVAKKMLVVGSAAY